MQGTSADAQWMRRALEAGTTACALWRGVRDAGGGFVDLELLEASDGYVTWAGRRREEMIGCRYSELVPSGVQERLDHYLRCLVAGQPEWLVFQPVLLPGRTEWAEVRIVPCGGDLLYIQTFDVTERERRARQLLEARDLAELQQARMLAVLNASPDGFAIYQVERTGEDIRDIRIFFVNDAAAAPTGLPSESWRGARLLEFFPEAVESGLYDRVIESIQLHEQQRFVLRTESMHGWHGSFENLVTPFGPDLALITWRQVALDVPAAADVVAGRDALTGTLHRSGFLQELERRLADGSAAQQVLVISDFDAFGHVNDVIGQHRADNLLAQFAAEAPLLHPRPLLVGRIGPDEFAMLFPAAEPADVEARFQRQQVLLAQLAKTYGLPRLHMSAGYTVIRGGDHAEDSLRDCDTALRYAIARGGGHMRAFTPALRSELLRRTGLVDDILRGLNAEEFRLAYQPIVELATGAEWGAESLVRWQHPDLGLLQPGQFITAAEASGLVVELGDWVLHEALAHIAATPGLPLVTVNVSSRQLTHDDLPTLVARALEAHGVAPQRLVVEITESALLPDSGRVRNQLRDLRKLGVRVALDDFGAGFSSIAYLDRLPVDIVKLDAFFLDGELTERRRLLVSSTAAMVASLGAVSLIEHVEAPEHLELALDAGVQLGQGYLFGRPEIPPCAEPDA